MKSKQRSSKSHVNWGEKPVRYASGGFVSGLASGLQSGLSAGKKKREEEAESELFPKAPEAPKELKVDVGLYRAGGKVFDYEKPGYANEYFDRPHPFKPLEKIPKGSEWPGLKVPKPARQDRPGKGLAPQMNKPVAPAELRPRKRRTEQEI